MAFIEQGPLRPPSEARSLLIRVARNCPWNRCSFCPAYKGEKFTLRSTREILDEIREVAALPQAGLVRTVFLQDADALITPVDRLIPLIRQVREGFPRLERMTAYGRSATLARRKVQDLERLREAGLTRVHVGLESGSDAVLQFTRKGVKAAQQLEGCRRVRAAGLELCCYVMPGLGGRQFSREHAHETGKLIAEIEPDHVRLRTCFVLEKTPLADDFAAGRFEPLGEEEIVREIREFLQLLSHTRTYLVSDHRINLLLELTGELPGDHERLMEIIDRFLALDNRLKRLFIAGRRLGLIRRLDELLNDDTIRMLEVETPRYREIVPVPRGILY